MSKKRTQESKFKAVEDKLVHYICLHQSLVCQCDKCGLSWIILQKKLVHWAAPLEEDEVYKNFEASPGFISRVLRDHDLIGVSLHGEANDMDDEEIEQIMSDKSCQQGEKSFGKSFMIMRFLQNASTMVTSLVSFSTRCPKGSTLTRIARNLPRE
jgi:hypothetical protein